MECEDFLSTSTVDARKLHKALSVKSRFNDWIRCKIGQYGLEEGLHYRVISSDTPAKAYELTSDTALEIIMGEKSDSARALKEEFIKLARKQSEILTSLSEVDLNLQDNPLDLVSGVAYLSSLKIAEISGKRHDNIIRDIENEIHTLKAASNRVLESALDFEEAPSEQQSLQSRPEARLTPPALAATSQVRLRMLKSFTRTLEGIKLTSYLDSQNKPRKAYLLDEAAAYQVLLKYSSEFRSLFVNYFLEVHDALMSRYKLLTIDKTLPETSGKRQYVYIIRDPYKEHIKVGIASDPHKRLSQLQTGNSTSLELEYVSYVCSNASEIEAEIHRHFKEQHILGEWFSADSSEVIEFLSKSRYILTSNLDFSLESKLNEVIFALEHPSET